MVKKRAYRMPSDLRMWNSICLVVSVFFEMLTGLHPGKSFGCLLPHLSKENANNGSVL